MLHVRHIESLDQPELVPYRTLRQSSDHEKQRIFVAEGEKVVARLIESDLEIQSLLITPDWLSVYRLRLESKPGDPAVFVGEKSLLSSIVGYHLHQGVMAVARIPEGATLDAIINHSPKPVLFVAIDGMTNSENLGVLVRNCAGFGVHALIVGETSSSPWLRRAVRNSMGAVFNLPIVHSHNLAKTLLELETKFSVRVIAAHPHADKRSSEHYQFKSNCCLVFGSEGYGISEKVLAACNDAVAIPMNRGVDSLNVSSASAVFLYEVVRQRNAEKISD
ncbi:MAG TPA: RNA methyltransferase [Bacteroidota bacterium]